ncbi:MAG: exodeoxyribonuclease VII large subunit [Bdellovibrionota bacterium]
MEISSSDSSQPSSTAENNDSVLTVEQLNQEIKQLMEGQFALLWVKGEISNFKPHTSGHFYFSLKDKKSQISAVMFRGYNSRLKFKPEDGMEVIVRGKISVYEPRGNYQILCELMEPVGAGALQKAYEQLKVKLQAEGLFESARKKPIPPFPKKIAIVTSPTGAAVRDIINILSRRAPHLEVIVVPALVQGTAAVSSLCAGFALAQRIPDLDVIIIGRGGGSVEDMWCFNDEGLARDIAASTIPVISAVGHEIDFTIADFVADLRAPTPSAAAELVSKSVHDTQVKLESLFRVLFFSMQKGVQKWQQKNSSLARMLADPRKRIENLILRHDELRTRLESTIQFKFQAIRHRISIGVKGLRSPTELVALKRKDLMTMFQRLARGATSGSEKRFEKVHRIMLMLDTLSPLKVVERGYSITYKNKKLIKSTNDLEVGDKVSVVLCHGEFEAEVTKKESEWTSKKSLTV